MFHRYKIILKATKVSVVSFTQINTTIRVSAFINVVDI